MIPMIRRDDNCMSTYIISYKMVSRVKQYLSLPTFVLKSSVSVLKTSSYEFDPCCSKDSCILQLISIFFTIIQKADETWIM